MSVNKTNNLRNFLGSRGKVGQGEVAVKRGLTEGKRANGYCLNTDCQHYARGIFILIPRADDFCCMACNKAMHVRIDQWWREGIGDIYKRVVIEYCYDPLDYKFHEMAIVKDNNIEEGVTLRFQSALITAEQRALKLAVQILGNLAINPKARVDEIKTPTLDISVNKKDWSAQLKELERKWSESPRAKILTFSD